MKSFIKLSLAILAFACNDDDMPLNERMTNFELNNF
jgi:hypothetical protein